MKAYQIEEPDRRKQLFSLVPVVKVFLLLAVPSYERGGPITRIRAGQKTIPLNTLAGCLSVLENCGYIPSNGLKITCYASVIFHGLFSVSLLPLQKNSAEFMRFYSHNRPILLKRLLSSTQVPLHSSFISFLFKVPYFRAHSRDLTLESNLINT